MKTKAPESWHSAIKGYKNRRRWYHRLDGLKKAEAELLNDNGDYLAAEAKAASYEAYLNENNHDDELLGAIETGNEGNENIYGIPVSGLKLIKKFEGCRLEAYKDPLSGNLPITIGWGSTVNKDGSKFKLGDEITKEEADDLLAYQCHKSYLPSISKIPYWDEMSDGKKGALLSFAYNLGAEFYGSNNFKTITAVLKNKQWNKVPATLYLYRNPGSNVEAGLAARRTAEGESWKNNTY